MNRRRTPLVELLPVAWRTCCGFALVGLVVTGIPRAARAEVEFEATWNIPTYDAVRADVQQWVDKTQPSADVVAAIDELWSEPSEDAGDGVAELGQFDLLDRVAASLAAADPRAAVLVTLCRADYQGPSTPDASWLDADDVPLLMRNNLRLYYARWLAQYGLYDEVLAQLQGLALADVVDPASLLFYRVVAHQQLVQPDEARAALVQLLEHREQLPRRFQQVAQLLDRDLAALDDESLDHVARRMNDIRRRLAYGRTGARVQEIERGVVDSLDQKIDELEKQQQQQQQQSQSQAGGAMQPASPMQDSQLPGMQAPMQVDQRDIGHSSGWGDLPPHEREQALQQIGRDFPAQYRDLIEQYFRELANESTPPAN